DRPVETDEARLLAEPRLSRFVTCLEVRFDLRIAGKRRRVRVAGRTQDAVHAVPLRKANPNAAEAGRFAVAASAGTGSRARTDPDELDGAMADDVVAVSEKIFRTELPARRDDPLGDSAE